MAGWFQLHLTIAALLGGVGLIAQAGHVWKADLHIRAFNLTLIGKGTIQARVVISTLDDDPARAVRLELLLPVGVGVIRLGEGCRPSPAPLASLASRVTCELGDLAARGVREITVMTSVPSSGSARFAAMVLSDTPDPTPSNNFSERVLQ